MEILGLLFLIVLFLGTFKLLGIFFKIGFFLISIPLQILGVVILAVLAVALVPAGIAALAAFIFAPLMLLGPLLPILLLGFLIYLLVK